MVTVRSDHHDSAHRKHILLCYVSLDIRVISPAFSAGRPPPLPADSGGNHLLHGKHILFCNEDRIRYCQPIGLSSVLLYTVQLCLIVLYHIFQVLSIGFVYDLYIFIIEQIVKCRLEATGKMPYQGRKNTALSHKMLDLAKGNKYRLFRLLNIYNLGQRACIF